MKIIAVLVLATIAGPLSNCGSIAGPPDPPPKIVAPASAK